MYSIILKQFFILYSSFYLYTKILNLNTNPKIYRFITAIVSCAIAIISNFLLLHFPCVSIVFPILLFYMVILVFTKTPAKLSLVATMISFGLSYATSSAFIFLFVTLFYIFSTSNNLPYNFILLFSGILSYMFLHIPFSHKRFKKGMQFLYDKTVLNFGAFVSLIILLCLTLGRILDTPSSITKVVPLLSILLLGFLLLFWWRNQITKSYLEKLRKAELKSLRQELEEKNAQIEKLRKNNDELARIIHRDNKLIPSMESVVYDLLEQSGELSQEDFKAKGYSLAKELRDMSASRAGILTAYQAKGQHIPITGVCSVDALLSYMQKQAASFEICFDVNISTNLVAFARDVISADDLSHLLSDLLENAIIATKNGTTKKIQLRISCITNQYIIEISDTGTSFPVEILQAFGIEQQTSHENDGGSGIGLMDIWKLKKKYRASLHIQEFPPNQDTFTKKISLIFDSKNHYFIHTYRPQEILMTLKRSDLYVFENESNH